MSRTPGPWKVSTEDSPDRFYVDTADDTAYVAKIIHQDGEEEAEANARLIAAAPELLRMLKVSHTRHKKFSVTCGPCAAIAKAEGRE